MKTSDVLKCKTHDSVECREEQVWSHDEHVTREPAEIAPTRAEPLSSGHIQRENRQIPDDAVCQQVLPVILSRSANHKIHRNDDLSLTKKSSSRISAQQSMSSTFRTSIGGQQARLQLIAKIRRLQAERKAPITSQVIVGPILKVRPQRPDPPAPPVYALVGSTPQYRRNPSNEMVSVHRVRPGSATISVLSASQDNEATFSERNRANKLLVELAKAKAEILTLRRQLAMAEKTNQACEEELSRFKRMDCNKDPIQPKAEARVSNLSSSWGSLWKQKTAAPLANQKRLTSETDAQALNTLTVKVSAENHLNLGEHIRRAIATDLTQHHAVQGFTGVARWVLRRGPRRRLQIPKITDSTNQATLTIAGNTIDETSSAHHDADSVLLREASSGGNTVAPALQIEHPGLQSSDERK